MSEGSQPPRNILNKPSTRAMEDHAVNPEEFAPRGESINHLHPEGGTRLSYVSLPVPFYFPCSD